MTTYLPKDCENRTLVFDVETQHEVIPTKDTE